MGLFDLASKNQIEKSRARNRLTSVPWSSIRLPGQNFAYPQPAW
jgi:hypothetical protein